MTPPHALPPSDANPAPDPTTAPDANPTAAAAESTSRLHTRDVWCGGPIRGASQGTIVQVGSYDELMAEPDGLFAELARRQEAD